MAEASSNSKAETRMTGSDRALKKAWQLIEALTEEAAHHGGLRTQKSLRLENELRLDLGKIGRT
jgi:hypothetical protein